ncbi:zinc finger BED domain-containing protein RICESLEEPER 2-like [Miscanthus floridulus]|uniref:zinc finger BED domain-containing protein RICESLEEPER 2-like n=1 Tax=Miscanthus floridulus TaxID=154761 RepID=UPI0034597A4C
MSIAMIEKYDKYWSDIQGLMALALILDPRLKMIMLKACYIALLGEDEADKYVKKSYELLIELMHEYHVQSDQEGVGTSSFGASSSTVSVAAVLSIFKSLAAHKQTSSLSKAKNELDHYLDEEPLPYNESEYFDVLGWWKVAGTRFPTLRMKTRDILAILVTTIAFESAFSTGGRVLSEHRSRLTPQMVEALMCSQSWLRHSLKDQDDDKVDIFWSCLEDVEEEMKNHASRVSTLTDNSLLKLNYVYYTTVSCVTV